MKGTTSCGPDDPPNKCWNPKKGRFKRMLQRIGRKIKSSFTRGGKEPHKMTKDGDFTPPPPPPPPKKPTTSWVNPNRMGGERTDPSGKDPKRSKPVYNKKKIRSY